MDLLHCCCNCRKRKTPEASVRPRIIRMVWDVDAESTNAIMKDVGVSLLTSDDKATDRGRAAASCRSAAESVQSRVNY